MAPTALVDRLLTADEFMRMPEPPNAQFEELVRGRVVRRKAHSFLHGLCCANVIGTLGNLVFRKRLGYALAGTGVVTETNPDTVRGPDVSYLSFDRIPAPLRDDYVRVPPNLVVEVLEPEERGPDFQAKVQEYLAFGCRMVWAVDPETNSLIVHRNSEQAQILRPGATFEFEDDILPGCSITVAELFDRHDP